MDKVSVGVMMNEGLTIRTAQQRGQKYVQRHQFSLNDAPHAYDMFKKKAGRHDACGVQAQLKLTLLAPDAPRAMMRCVHSDRSATSAATHSIIRAPRCEFR